MEEKDEVMLVTANGVCTRLKAGDISCQGRPATGVKAQNLTGDDVVVSVNKIIKPDDDEAVSSSAQVEEIVEQVKLLDTDS